MDLQLNAPVVAREGEEIGKVDRVVFDPATGKTESIVVRKGFLLTRDVAIPTEKIRVAAPGRIEIDMSKEEFESQPQFVDSDFRQPPEDWVAPYGWPTAGVLWPGGAAGYPGAFNVAVDTIYAQAPKDETDIQRDDERDAEVGSGAPVLSRDGDQVGELAEMVIDNSTKRPASLIMRRGLLFKEDVEIPGAWIDAIYEGRIALNVDKRAVEQLVEKRDLANDV